MDDITSGYQLEIPLLPLLWVWYNLGIIELLLSEIQEININNGVLFINIAFAKNVFGDF